MATLEQLVNKVQNEKVSEISKQASVNEMEKFASALNELAPKELVKVAQEIESLETAESMGLIKEADAYGRYVARGYWDRVLEHSSQQS